MKNTVHDPIDFVVLWVDDQDPKWQQERAKYRDTVSSETNGDNRYRDWDLFPYMFRAFEKFTPWVNRIHLVTCGHYPSWLNLTHPKLTLVRHDEFIPAEYLPTFSSNAIELNLHRIPGLSESFVYFNDDFFPIRPLSREAFFKNSLPCDIFIQTLSSPSKEDLVMSQIQFNTLGVTSKHFDKKSFLIHHPAKYLSPHYGKYAVRNLYLLPINKLTGFRSLHSSASFKKNTLETLWELEHEVLHETCLRKFRSAQDVNQYVFAQHQIMKGEFAPINPKKRPYFAIGQNREKYARIIRKQKADIICLNDVYEVDVPFEKQFLISCFDSILPEKSSFEL